MKSVLVTGGAGFIGSNFIKLANHKHPDWCIVNVDALTYAGSLENLEELNNSGNHMFVKGDITHAGQMRDLFDIYHFDYVINFAAESHVDRSIKDPELFVKTNVQGTQCLLSCAKDDWQTGLDGSGYPTYRAGVRFLQISTDEVYGPSVNDKRFTEASPLLPSSPYAASKASADLMVLAFKKTYKMPINITRSSNNYGPCQNAEKLIPLAINNALKGTAIPVYGDGLQKRDWIYVLDNCNAIDAVLVMGRMGEIYNIGTGDERTNIEVVRQVLALTGKPESLAKHVQDRLGHDRRYALDTRKIAQELGWKPLFAFEQGLLDTVKWYLSKQ